ncbi:hypothetical protein VIGAN_UM002800, partial [Vigna angularis var. angularis]
QQHGSKLGRCKLKELTHDSGPAWELTVQQQRVGPASKEAAPAFTRRQPIRTSWSVQKQQHTACTIKGFTCGQSRPGVQGSRAGARTVT